MIQAVYNEDTVASIEFDLDSFKDKNSLTHNYHPYPGKFVPQIPRLIIQRLSRPGDWILDPFCGCGTSLVEAALANRNSVGLDVNPLACLIAKVKTTLLSTNQLSEAWSATVRTCNEISSLYYSTLASDHVIPASPPDFRNLKMWFEPNIIRELGIIKTCVQEVQDIGVRDFLRVAFSAIIVSVSNQESETRYASITKHLAEQSTSRVFHSKVRDMIERMRLFSKSRSDADCRVAQCDVSVSVPIEDSFASLVVTSPPYPNTYDYYLYHKLRMMWLDMDYKQAQEREFGSRHKHSDLGEGIDQYILKMEQCMKNVSRTLRIGGHFCIVIGDSILKKRYIAMNEVTRRIVEQSGLQEVREIHYPLRKYTRAFTPNMKSLEKLAHIMFFRKNE